MIAKRIPRPEERSGKRLSVALAYGLTPDEFNRADLDFLENEGYHSDGHESETLHDWLTYEPKRFTDNTPWQKGDDQPY